MRAYDQGAVVRVVANYHEVQNFKDNWPGSGLPDNSVCFIFERNGDILEVYPSDVDGDDLMALMDECKAYATRKGLLQ